MLLSAARSGDKSAYLSLGYAYDNGLGVRRSKRKAVRWYLRSVAAGESAGANNLATIYRDRGDVSRTVRWLRKAIELGDSGAHLLLGQILLGHNHSPEGALASFRAVGSDACQADMEAADVWQAVAETMVALEVGEARP